MLVLGLFSGIGGFTRGLELAGHTSIGEVESDPFCQRVLAERWPGIPKFPDVRTVSEEDMRTVNSKRKVSLAHVEESVRMYERGLSCGAIAAYYGISRQAMWDLLRRRTTMRPNLRFGEENHFHRGGVTQDDQANNMVETAVNVGALVPPSVCETCGSAGAFSDGRRAIQAHHADYNKPLDVRWLCQRCHHEWHRHHQAIRKEVMPQEAPDKVDLLVGGFP